MCLMFELVLLGVFQAIRRFQFESDQVVYRYIFGFLYARLVRVRRRRFVITFLRRDCQALVVLEFSKRMLHERALFFWRI